MEQHKRVVSGLLALVFVFYVFDLVVLLRIQHGLTPLTSVPTVKADSSGFVYIQNGKLMLDGQDYRFTGINAYELATDWGVNPGCGGMLTDQQLDDFFSSLAPYSMVRMWAFQGSMAIDNSHQINWGPLDRIINAAGQYNIKLDLGLTDQAGTCDDGYWKDPAWYNGGYKDINTNPNNYDYSVESYQTYVQQIVSRYANNPTIAFWEPVNEPEGSECSDPANGASCGGNTTCNEAVATPALISFYDNIGSLIRGIDPNALIAGGTEGGGQCGLQGTDYVTVMQQGNIDVATYHDYSDATDTLPGDQWNGMAVRATEMAALGKPIISEEVGISAYDPPPNGCLSLEQRAPDFQAKMDAQFAAGYQGFMPWDWVPPGGTTGCSLDINIGDPVLAILKANAFVLNPPTTNGGGNTSGTSGTTNSSSSSNTSGNYSNSSNSNKKSTSKTPTTTNTTTNSTENNSSSPAAGNTTSVGQSTNSNTTSTNNSAIPTAPLNLTVQPAAGQTVKKLIGFSIIMTVLIISGTVAAMVFLYRGKFFHHTSKAVSLIKSGTDFYRNRRN